MEPVSHRQRPWKQYNMICSPLNCFLQLFVTVRKANQHTFIDLPRTKFNSNCFMELHEKHNLLPKIQQSSSITQWLAKECLLKMQTPRHKKNQWIDENVSTLSMCYKQCCQEMEKQLKESEVMFANHLSDERVVSKMHVQLIT